MLAPAGDSPFAGRCTQAANAKPSLINSAITAAGLTTNASLNYLVHVAILESRLRTYAHAPSSSAAGLFQFTKQTWLAMLKRHGASNGLSHYADAIEKRANRWVIADPGEADAIYSLRQDPTVSAAMAAELAKENAAILQRALGREPSDGELYAAHFLGPDGAAKLVAAKAKTPSRDFGGVVSSRRQSQSLDVPRCGGQGPLGLRALCRVNASALCVGDRVVLQGRLSAGEDGEVVNRPACQTERSKTCPVLFASAALGRLSAPPKRALGW